jgi:hypothetical protein
VTPSVRLEFKGITAEEAKKQKAAKSTQNKNGNFVINQKKQQNMTTTAIKKQIHQAIDTVENPEILKAVQLILNQEIKHSQEIISPFTLEEFYERNTQSQKEIKQGKLIDHKTL